MLLLKERIVHILLYHDVVAVYRSAADKTVLWMSGSPPDMGCQRFKVAYGL